MSSSQPGAQPGNPSRNQRSSQAVDQPGARPEIRHLSADAEHYDIWAADYDALNEARSAVANAAVERLLRGQGARTVLDLACGTGSQLFWLARRGFAVTGCDISSAMLAVARAKARQLRLDMPLHLGDMRTSVLGGFDAAIAIFNAVGHLTRDDFGAAIRNAWANLRPGGCYLFDIFNRQWLERGDNITGLTIDWLAPAAGGGSVRKLQFSTLAPGGVLASHTLTRRQRGAGAVAEEHHYQTLQVYSADELARMLRDQGFELAGQFAADGGPFDPAETDRILTLARKP